MKLESLEHEEESKYPRRQIGGREVSRWVFGGVRSLLSRFPVTRKAR